MIGREGEGEGGGGSSSLSAEELALLECFGPDTPGSPQGRGSIMSVGDGPQTPESWERDWETGRVDWEEMHGWDVETQDCASTQDASSREDPGEALDDTPDPGSAHYPFFTEEYSSMILWEPSREKT